MADSGLSILNNFVDQSHIQSFINRLSHARSFETRINGIFPLNSELKKASAYIQRILVQERHPILFLGESSTLSMTIALALMRGSFDGIWSSSHQLKCPPRDTLRIQGAVRDQCARMSEIWRWYSNAFAALVDTAVVRRISLEIDATQLSRTIKANPHIPTSLIWFPFPRTLGSGTQKAFLKKIMESVKSVQDENGGVLLLGLSQSPIYGYGLDVAKYAALLDYEHMSDERFMKETCCAYGYTHRWIGQDLSNAESIHHKVINPSIFHVFVLRPRILRNVNNAHSIN